MALGHVTTEAPWVIDDSSSMRNHIFGRPRPPLLGPADGATTGAYLAIMYMRQRSISTSESAPSKNIISRTSRLVYGSVHHDLPM